MKKFLLYSILFISCRLYGQDIHFSLFNEMPLNLNPALAGVGESKQKAGLIYRNQWNSVSTPFQSSGFTGDMRYTPTFLNEHTFGIGLQFLNDRSGNGSFQQNHFHLVLNYQKFIDKRQTHLVTGGFKTGFFQKSFDPTKLTFESDYSYPSASFQSNGANENFDGNSTAKFDLGLGLSYTKFNKLGNAQTAGIAFDHLNTPDQSLYNGTDELKVRTTIHGTGTLQLNSNSIVHPSIIIRMHNKAYNYIGGAQIVYSIGRALIEDTDVKVGVFYRVDDAAYLTFGINHDNWSINFAYDFTISTLGEAARNVNAFEIGISIRNKLFNPKALKYIVPGNRFL